MKDYLAQTVCGVYIVLSGDNTLLNLAFYQHMKSLSMMQSQQYFNLLFHTCQRKTTGKQSVGHWRSGGRKYG